MAVATTAAAADKSVSPKPWAVKPDPGADLTYSAPSDLTHSVAIRSGHLVFPSYSGRFVAVHPKASGPPLSDDWFQVYDVQDLHPIGPAFAAPVNLGQLHVLSPDGAYLAGRTKDAPATVSIWDCKTGLLARSFQISDEENRYGFPAEFVGPGRLLTKCHDGLFPLAEAATHYQLWDVASGKEVLSFDAGLVWSSKWCTISPGGRYLVMEKTENKSYRLLAWDLTTGQSAGEAEFQGKNDPWGQACGVVFSPDATKLAIVWRLGKPDLWGKVIIFDVVQGKSVGSAPLDFTMKHIGLALNINDHPALQWTPDGNGWLILGHLLMDANTGAVLGKVGREPANSWEVEQRRFIGPQYLTAISEKQHQRELTFTEVRRSN